MNWRCVAALAILVPATTANAQSQLEDGFAGALRGCEEWVLNPDSWANGIGPFVSKVGLGNKMGLVKSVDEVSLPPKELRIANHYWRINSAKDAGYVLVVSDRLPMCHITGGGSSDLQPVVESVLAGEAFQRRWRKFAEKTRGDMVTTRYRNQTEPAFTIALSRAKSAGMRQDRVQVLATAQMELDS